MSNRAWVTLATNDSYGLGALVLAHSLRRVASTYPAVVLITPSVTDAMRTRLSSVFAEVITVNVLDSQDAAHLALLQRPELGITFTKIHCWNLTQYDKCVFLDADILVVQNCDELFEREELSAAPDVGWPDCFNSGVFVFQPSADTFSKLITFAQERGSFDGGDQGLLNSYFSNWSLEGNKRLPFLYNVTSAAFYSYLPALKHYGQDLKVIHFIGAGKPWLQQYNFESHSVEAPEHLKAFLQLWWDLFTSQVHPQLNTTMEKAQETSPKTHNDSAGQIDFSESKLDCITYQPIVDSTSEFPWHHPDPITEETTSNDKVIDESRFHDPWEGLRGNIPPRSSDKGVDGGLQDQQDVREYAWKYITPHEEYSQLVQLTSNHSHTPNQTCKGNTSHNDTSYHSNTTHSTLNNLIESEKFSTLPTYHNNKKMEYTYNIQTNYENTRSQPKRIDYQIKNDYRNSYIDDEDSIFNDDVTPRHPYDGFYLRHRITINSHGQKLCSHEIPPPSYSSSSDSSEEYEDTIEPLENGYIAEIDNETGVAGNLARVTPGAPSQREAIDELTRRQGWETGNIDYMGADSFANIWAKISESLGQTPSEKQPSPPKESPPAPLEPAKETVQDLAEKVAVSVITEPEPTNIPLPASEAAKSAGKTTFESNVDNLVPEINNETPTNKSDVSEPNETVATDEPIKPATSEPSQLESEPVLESVIPLEPPTQENVLPGEITQEQKLPAESTESVETKTASSIESVKNIDTPTETEVSSDTTLSEPHVEPAPASEVPQPEPEQPLQLHAPETVPEISLQQSEAAPVLSTIPSSTPEQKVSDLHEEKPKSDSIEAIDAASVPVTTEVHEPVPVPESLEAKSDPVPAAEQEKDSSAPDIEDKPEIAPENPSIKPELDTSKTEVVPTISEQDKTPPKTEVPVSTSDSPPLANTPSREEIPSAPAAKLEECRKPAGKLQLSPPVAADPIPTPDSELEDAATLAQSIIASELRTPTVTSPTPTDLTLPQLTTQSDRLEVDKPDVPTPPLDSVSLEQIGVKPKTKPSTAAQIESSLPDKETPKKKVVKKAAKKDGASSSETPVPPPRKKEKKPK